MYTTRNTKLRYISLIPIVVFLVTFNSCSVIRSVLEYNDCEYSGCDSQKLENCNYCGFHCNSYTVPSDFNAKISKSIDEQIEISRKQNNNK